MHRSRVSGDYHEMGFRYGGILFEHGFRIPKQEKECIEFGRKSESEVRKTFPDILDEMKGFAEGCHSPYDDVISFMMGVGLGKLPKCSLFAAAGGPNIIFGRNYDFYYRFKDYTESYLTVPQGGYASLGDTDVFIGREDGANEKGLAVGMSSVQSQLIRPGVNFAIAVRCVLDKCSAVEEAVGVLTNTNFSTTNNYLLADRSGALAVVEASPDKIKVRRPGDEPWIVATNHFNLPEMASVENVHMRPPDSKMRYDTLWGFLQSQGGKVDVEASEKALADHSGKVCSHIDKIEMGTLWSVVVDLSQMKVFRAEGHPCSTPYEEDTRLAAARHLKTGRHSVK
jgi:predicted choloylglycine hydrolase